MSNALVNVVETALTEINRKKQSALYFSDPNAWVNYMLDMKLWSKQREIGQSVVHNKSTAVKSGHGVGKSMTVAFLICWWVDTRFPDAFVASTAPSQKQIGAIVWREVRKIYARIAKRYKEGLIDHELPGYITMDNEWKSSDGVIIGFGRKPPDQKESDSFQGIHGNVLAVGDEAVGLSEAMIDALGNITSNQASRRIIISNPTNPGSHFGKIFKENTGAWALHTISVFDSPNFTDEKDEMPAEALEMLTGVDYVEDKKREYGENSARYKARVLGEFAWDLGDTLIKPEDIAVAIDNELFISQDTPVVLGVDVARFGKDSTVIYKQEGGVLRYVNSWAHNTRTTEVAAQVHKAAVDLNATEVRIDASGIGGGVVDVLMTYEDRRYTIISMNSNGATPDRKKWHNARAMWWDMFRRDLREGHIDLDMVDERLQDELQSVEYKFSTQSLGLLIESKDDMRKRGMKSPDFADAAIYACADMDYMTQIELQPGDRLRATLEQILGDDLPAYFTALDW